MSSVNDPTPLHAPEKPASDHHGSGHGNHAGHGEHGAFPWVHITPWQTLVKVWLALMALTYLTVAATWVDLGTANIWVAMIIAVIKGSLVVLYFMHLKHNKPFIGYVFTFSLAFVAFFLAMVMMDSKGYQPDVEQRRLDDPEQTVELGHVALAHPA
ncbi:MAG TPA: cytochrome C oxidase subunit IV family protein, partial [Gemmatales bacterium]|nr:cytochrome C oxidase subunit IV family protein [Gemmatales bacterium]